MRKVITWVLTLTICAAFALPALAAVEGKTAPGTEAAGEGPVIFDLNSVSYDELLGIKGIGPALAERILDHRARKGHFRSVDELLEIRGIGEKTFSRFKNRFTLAPPPSPVVNSSRPSP